MSDCQNCILERSIAFEFHICSQLSLLHIEGLAPVREVLVLDLPAVDSKLHIQEHRTACHSADAVLVLLVEHSRQNDLAGSERAVVSHDSQTSVRHRRAVVILARRHLHNPTFLSHRRNDETQEGQH